MYDRISDDSLIIVLSFLEPRDFYNLQTILKQNIESLYWPYRDLALYQVTLCKSLMKYAIKNKKLNDEDIQSIIYNFNSDSDLIDYYIKTSSNLEPLMYIFIVKNEPYYLFRVCAFTEYIINEIYYNSRYTWLAKIWDIKPMDFARWLFSNFKNSVNLKKLDNVLMYVFPLFENWKKFQQLMFLYHDFLWYKISNQLDIEDNIARISLLHKHNIVKFDPEKYKYIAFKNPHILNYLVLNGMKVETSMLTLPCSTASKQIIYDTLFVQNYNKIMLFLLLLIGIFLLNLYSKIEKYNIKNVEKHYSNRYDRKVQ